MDDHKNKIIIALCIVLLVTLIFCQNLYDANKRYEIREGQNYIDTVHFLSSSLSNLNINNESSRLLELKNPLIRTLAHKYIFLNIQGSSGTIMFSTMNEIENILWDLNEENASIRIKDFENKTNLLIDILSLQQEKLGSDPLKWYRELNNTNGNINKMILDIYNSYL